MHSDCWGLFADHLSQDFLLHRVDLPGHGRDSATGPWFLETAAERLLQQTPPAHWLGWSLGGLVALAAALKAPGHVRSLVLITCNPRFVATDDWPDAQTPEAFARFRAGLAEDAQASIERFLSDLFHEPGTASHADRFRALHSHFPFPEEPALESGARILAETDLRDRLGRIPHPALWIAGSEDRFVPPRACRLAAGMMPSGRSECVSGAGHVPFHTNEARTCSLVHDFLHADRNT